MYKEPKKRPPSRGRPGQKEQTLETQPRYVTEIIGARDKKQKADVNETPKNARTTVGCSIRQNSGVQKAREAGTLRRDTTFAPDISKDNSLHEKEGGKGVIQAKGQFRHHCCEGECRHKLSPRAGSEQLYGFVPHKRDKPARRGNYWYGSDLLPRQRNPRDTTNPRSGYKVWVPIRGGEDI